MKPLRQMRKITQNFAAGNWHERMPSSEIPELNLLSKSFNSMATGLEDVESRRRELVSDLTHELRTPLNSIIGYSEIMLMGINGPLNEETTEDVEAILKSGETGKEIRFD